MNPNAAVKIIVMMLALVVGCTRAPAPAVKPNLPVVVEKDDRDNPMVKEARAQTEELLNGILAGKYDTDDNLAPIARKLKGFRSWSIDRQEVNHDLKNGVDFTGTLTGPTNEATFTATVVKQQDGKWMIGSFSGPRPKN